MTIFVFTLISVAVIALDQLSKAAASAWLKPITSFHLWDGVFHLTYVENRGAAFGILKDQRWIFIVLSIVAMLVIAAYVILKRKELHPLLLIALSFLFGGGIGNMIDRIAYGYVVDFLDFTLIDFAVFNVADTFVCVGAGLLILYILLHESGASKKSDGKGH